MSVVLEACKHAVQTGAAHSTITLFSGMHHNLAFSGLSSTTPHVLPATPDTLIVVGAKLMDVNLQLYDSANCPAWCVL